ncbi:MAG: DUF2950 family protein [Pseudomonadota bacterium]
MKHLLPACVAIALGLPAFAEAPVYASPQQAVEALAAALQDGSVEAVVAVMDPDAAEFLRDPDDPANTAHLAELAALYAEGYRFVPQAGGGVVIELGREGWPLAVPLARGEAGWQFDIAAGREEVISRRIGRNELDVIDVLQAYVALQHAYRTVDHDGDGVLEFAASVLSSPGARDGLYWPGDGSPIGDLAARAHLDGFDAGAGPEQPEPFRGYYFRVLQEQGDRAPGGAYSYLVNGNMVAGHAMLAVPAEYGVTGITSFLVSEAGVVMERDLGPATVATALGITSFDPGEGWAPVAPE